ncbi:MAG: CRTAC1 family protein [Acidobacteriota bacterium]
MPKRSSMRSRRSLLWNAGLAGMLIFHPVQRGSQSDGPSDPIFEAVIASRSGIRWVHDNGMSPERWLPESMCSGCAFFDFDNDGWMDIFLVNTGPCDFYQPKKDVHSALYRNNRDGTFTDTTEKAGLHGRLFGEGVAVGDYDGDGWPDIYLTGYGRNILYHNNRDGTFTDLTEEAGLTAKGWSTSAVWFDYDNDGRLDLFVCSFVDYSGNNKVFCGNNEIGVRYYCLPRLFESRFSHLFHNNGDGTFKEVGHRTAIGKSPCKAHGAVATDINNDGLMDLFVANDTVANYLFVNRGNGEFEEIGFTAGVAYSDHGQPRSGMGVDSGDYDNDGLMDLFVANIDRERFSIYRNAGREMFSDMAAQTGIGRATYFLSGWGLKFFDYDNDGNLDLILSNGHPDDMVETYTVNVTWKEPLLLFHGDGKTLTDVSRSAGREFQMHWGARGLAVGDYDNDGGLDVLINNNGDAPLLLHNRHGKQNNWVGLKLVGRDCNVDAVGAIVTWSFDGRTKSRLKTSGGSYLSSHDPRVVCGIGESKKVDWLEVKWPRPSGKIERFTSLPLNRYVTVVEGKGIMD